MARVEVQPQVFGTATIVLSSERRGHLWVARQRTGKEITGRRVGEIDIFTETAVVDYDGIETSQNNRIASLAEMIDNNGLREVGGSFHLVHANDRFRESTSTPGVNYRTAIVIFDGPANYSFGPAARNEVEPALIVPLSVVTDSANDTIRPIAREVVQAAVDLGLIDEAYRRYDDGDMVPAFPPWLHDIEGFQRHRDTMMDCVIFDRQTAVTK